MARRQHGVVSRAQLLELGLSRLAIEHRLSNRRLHRVARGVYAVGRPELTLTGRWMVAILACDPLPHPFIEGGSAGGPRAALSHRSAAALWGIVPSPAPSSRTEVTLRGGSGGLRRPEVRVHRRPTLERTAIVSRQGIPVTNVLQTLLDLSGVLDGRALERAVNEADRLGLLAADDLRAALPRQAGRRGVAVLRELLDRPTFRLTESELERRFLALVASAGLPTPQTQVLLDGHRVDFYWPDLGVVVETDGLRYHRTPAKQSGDQLRDLAHATAGRQALRFSHALVHDRPEHVVETLRNVLRERARRRSAA